MVCYTDLTNNIGSYIIFSGVYLESKQGQGIIFSTPLQTFTHACPINQSLAIWAT